jgi:hypothetical protein
MGSVKRSPLRLAQIIRFVPCTPLSREIAFRRSFYGAAAFRLIDEACALMFFGEAVP